MNIDKITGILEQGIGVNSMCFLIAVIFITFGYLYWFETIKIKWAENKSGILPIIVGVIIIFILFYKIATLLSVIIGITLILIPICDFYIKEKPFRNAKKILKTLPKQIENNSMLWDIEYGFQLNPPICPKCGNPIDFKHVSAYSETGVEHICSNKECKKKFVGSHKDIEFAMALNKLYGLINSKKEELKIE